LITTYQIRNVLRVYGNQLKRRNEQQVKESMGPNPEPLDLVNISVNARQKEVLSRMSTQIISKMNPKDNQGKNEALNPLNSKSSEASEYKQIIVPEGDIK
jgi:hypothetical protein